MTDISEMCGRKKNNHPASAFSSPIQEMLSFKITQASACEADTM